MPKNNNRQPTERKEETSKKEAEDVVRYLGFSIFFFKVLMTTIEKKKDLVYRNFPS
jgi:hypothetical protein